MMKSEDHLETITDILQGFSVTTCSFGLLYFKHLSQPEQRELLTHKSVILQEAKELGLPSQEESLSEVVANGLWGKEQDDIIQTLKEDIESLNKVSKRLILPSKKREIDSELSEKNNKLQILESDKKELLGLTRERFVEQKLQKMTMERSMFYDKEFTKSVFSDLYVNEHQKELELYEAQANFLMRFSDQTISTAVLSDYFSAYLPFCEDVIGVFGKPLAELNLYQVKLISYGRYFLNLFKNCQKEIPENIAKDPELLISFYESQREGGSSVRKSRGQSDASTFFGATKEDLEAIKEEDENAVVLSEAIQKQGGSLNMQQMMELHGV